MESINTIKKKNNQFRPNTFSSKGFKKFKMDFDATGIHILISASFLKKENYKIEVQNGRLRLKIKCPKENEEYIDFDILLPDKRYQYINSALFENDTLQIQLTQKDNIGSYIKLVEAS
ncbi:hypothetical protein [Cognatitamlana onchidii]|uniref:hypothetical protein n=1 Tax=Cognatitamlana onchidii TaxID=2562860 RepID=UPI0010A63BA3|nr:hypothetical protein [Algibacter onchidii]